MTLGKAAAIFRKFPLHVCVLAFGFVMQPAPLFALIFITMQSVPGSRPLVPSGTANVTLNYGQVSAFEALPGGVTRTVSASAYTISTGFGVQVRRVGRGSSPSYTLQARLQSPHALTWRVDGTALSTVSTTVATNQPYATTMPHTLAFTVPFTHPSGVVTTVIEVLAIAN